MKSKEFKYYKLLNLLKEGVVQIDQNDTITYLNESFAVMLGYTVEELTGLKIYQIIDSDAEPLARQYVENRRRGISEEHDFTFRRKDGLAVHTIINTAPLTDDAGNYTGGLATITDITDRWKNEHDLKMSRLRFNQVSDLSHTVIWEVDTNGLFTYVNASVEKVLGYQAGDLIGKRYFYDLHPEAGREQFKEDMLGLFESRKQIIDFENPVETSDGFTIWIVTCGIPVIDENGNLTGYRGVHHDNTNSRIAKIHLEQSVELLKHLNQYQYEAREAERASLAATIHDSIGQAMTAIKINLQKLSNSKGVCSQKLINHIISITDEAVKQLQNISAELRPDILNTMGLIPAIHWYAQDFQTQTGIRCHLETDNMLIQNSDLELMLFRVMQEAFTNVVRHAKASNIFLKIKSLSNNIFLEISDDGIGFDREILNSNRSFGIIGMKERVEYFKGEIDFFNDNGMIIRVKVPFPGEDTSEKSNSNTQQI